MPVRLVILIFTVVAVVFVSVVAIKTQKKDPFVSNATVGNIRKGSTAIACEDATMLADIFSRMLSEEITLMEEFEKPFSDNNTHISEESLLAMRREMSVNPSPAQKEFEQWHNEVMLFINDFHKGNTGEIRKTEDAVGSDITELYYVVSGMKLEMASEAETLETIRERYCPENTLKQ
ncbi:MAG: hypothetical protein LBH05_07560 [Deferribacteraceae bacterium]|jgi:hypothetical protein|nr:hypothetical protein [Deferribacteraceae bacterium]